MDEEDIFLSPLPTPNCLLLPEKRPVLADARSKAVPVELALVRRLVGVLDFRARFLAVGFISSNLLPLPTFCADDGEMLHLADTQTKVVRCEEDVVGLRRARELRDPIAMIALGRLGERILIIIGSGHGGHGSFCTGSGGRGVWTRGCGGWWGRWVSLLERG